LAGGFRLTIPPYHSAQIIVINQTGGLEPHDQVLRIQESNIVSTDTIFALSSGVGRSGVAIIRVSGPLAGGIVEQVTQAPPPQPRAAVLRCFRDAKSEIIDEGLLLWFEGPASYTGEDVGEFHVHGGPAIIKGMLDALAAIEGARPAEPGEFTRRAFDAGRLDLADGEGLADLLAAETAHQRRQALRQSRGELSALYETWRTRLLRAIALLEAQIDFADEDLPEELAVQALGEATALQTELTDHLADDGRGERLRDGFQVVILGPPNAGKSSLLNLLANREMAIVSDTPGTTRDLLEAHLDLGGFPVTVIDTAGMREVVEAVEAEGVRRARRRGEEADFVIWMQDARQSLEHTGLGSPSPDLILLNKIDLLDQSARAQLAEKERDGQVCISIENGEGVEALIERLAAAAEGALAHGDRPSLTRARHRHALEACCAALVRASALDREALELIAEEMRHAARQLGRITGRFDVEDMLGVIFSEFCIGK
jgi:tRNA modification GTPase